MYHEKYRTHPKETIYGQKENNISDLMKEQREPPRVHFESKDANTLFANFAVFLSLSLSLENQRSSVVTNPRLRTEVLGSKLLVDKFFSHSFMSIPGEFCGLMPHRVHHSRGRVNKVE
jgi:hypothetical protein